MSDVHWRCKTVHGPDEPCPVAPTRRNLIAGLKESVTEYMNMGNPMANEFTTEDGLEKVTVCDPPDCDFVLVSRAERTKDDMRFRCIEGVAIPRELLDAVIGAMRPSR